MVVFAGRTGNLCWLHAGVTQLAECLLPKQNVAGSNPVSRSTSFLPSHGRLCPRRPSWAHPLAALTMEEGSSSMERDDPAYEGQREYTPLFLKIYDPLVIGSSRRSCGGARRLASWRGTGGTSATGTSTWAPGRATSWNEPASLTAARSPSSTPTCTSSSMHPGAAAPGRHDHRGRRLQATSRRRAVRLRRAQRRASLPAGTTPEQGCGRRECGRRPRADRRPVRCIDPRVLGPRHLVGVAHPRGQLSARNLRDPAATPRMASARSSRHRSSASSWRRSA